MLPFLLTSTLLLGTPASPAKPSPPDSQPATVSTAKPLVITEARLLQFLEFERLTLAEHPPTAPDPQAPALRNEGLFLAARRAWKDFENRVSQRALQTHAFTQPELNSLFELQTGCRTAWSAREGGEMQASNERLRASDASRVRSPGEPANRDALLAKEVDGMEEARHRLARASSLRARYGDATVDMVLSHGAQLDQVMSSIMGPD